MSESEPPTAAATATVDQPKRRRWKRWTALGLVLAIGCGVWMAGGEGATVRRAKGLRVGMTEAEVDAVMGRPVQWSLPASMGGSQSSTRTRSYATRSENLAYQLKRHFHGWLWGLGLRDLSGRPHLPVEVVTEDGRVVWLRRGSEVIEDTPASQSP